MRPCSLKLLASYGQALLPWPEPSSEVRFLSNAFQLEVSLVGRSSEPVLRNSGVKQPFLMPYTGNQGGLGSALPSQHALLTYLGPQTKRRETRCEKSGLDDLKDSKDRDFVILEVLYVL